jgi:hypothetical protein
MVKKLGFVFAAIPVLGWLLSLLWNWLGTGTPFTAHGEWNNLPLVLTTIPCLWLWQLLNDNHVLRYYPYAVLLLYVFICTGLYFFFGAALGLLVRRIASMFKPRS